MRIPGLIKLLRPLNVFITISAVWAAAFISAEQFAAYWLSVLLGSIAAGMIASAGYIHNDIIDIEVDRVNRPDRPLPGGKVSVTAAVISAVILTAAGLTIGISLGPEEAAVTLSAAFLLYVYNRYLKMTVIWGNLSVSLLTALCFIFGGILVNNAAFAVIPAVFSLFFHFGREVVKDMEDIAGDSRRSGYTFPQKYGIPASKRLITLSLTILLLTVPIPYFAHLLNIYYIIISIIGVEIPLLWILFHLWFSKNEPKLRILSQVLKYSMIIGLLALTAGA
ncbi:geranylgeranylglycerol-phosphate geranylgeranyltransferase [bacterium]|nr:geranylgeranylglycerol-phosphate geranylgeranyltransferase [bacterium]